MHERTDTEWIKKTFSEEARYGSSLADFVHDVVLVLDADATVRYANRAIEELLGYRPRDLRGTRILDYVHPEDVEMVSKALVEIARNSVGGTQLECRWRHTDGSWRHVEANVNSSPGGPSVAVVVTLRDITELNRLERALHRSEELHRRVVELAAENIFIVNIETGRILETNAALQRSLGYAPEELTDMTLYDIVAHDRASIDRDIGRVVAERRSFLGERRYKRKDGTLVDVEAGVSIVSHEGGKAMCVVAHDVTERKQTERELQRNLDALLTIYEAGHILGSTLKAEEIGSRLLQLMQRIARCITAVISVPDDRRQLRVWRGIGLENLWRTARFTPDVRATLDAVMEDGRHTFSLLRTPQPDAELLTALFLPLRIRNRTVGVLEVYGPDAATDKDALDILLNLTTKAASALENAQLYGKLTERERQLEELVGRLLVTQEEERRRVAHEVHDGPTQVAVAAYQHLQAFATMYPPETPEGRRFLDEAVELTRRVVRESRQVIEHLRPTVLDDFGLVTAIRVLVEELRAEGWRIGWEENVGNAHIPSPLEAALYRVAQEALVNVRKHARTTRVRLRLRRSRRGLRFQIRDWGVGFRLDSPRTGGPGEQVGLAGMRERIALIGGTLRIYSKEGSGTLLVADIPYSEDVADRDIDLAQRSTFAGRTATQ